MFRPGETVIHNFVIPFKKEEVDRVVVSYKQLADVILERTITSAQLEPYDSSTAEEKSKLTVRISQEESLLFDDSTKYRIQLNVITKGGSRHTSRELNDSTDTQHIREVIANG